MYLGGNEFEFWSWSQLP